MDSTRPPESPNLTPGPPKYPDERVRIDEQRHRGTKVGGGRVYGPRETSSISVILCGAVGRDQARGGGALRIS